MKKNNKKGFTLAELLIVVAIIAVLSAIAIPLFNTQLEKSRDSVSLSNLRAAYAQAQAAVIANSYRTPPAGGTMPAITEGDVTIKEGFNFGTNTGEVTVKNVDIKTQKADSWSGLTADNQTDFTMPKDAGTPINNATVTFKYSTNTDGAFTIAASYA